MSILNNVLGSHEPLQKTTDFQQRRNLNYPCFLSTLEAKITHLNICCLINAYGCLTYDWNLVIAYWNKDDDENI